jgi:hypothetical protein
MATIPLKISADERQALDRLEEMRRALTSTMCSGAGAPAVVAARRFGKSTFAASWHDYVRTHGSAPAPKAEPKFEPSKVWLDEIANIDPKVWDGLKSLTKRDFEREMMGTFTLPVAVSTVQRSLDLIKTRTGWLLTGGERAVNFDRLNHTQQEEVLTSALLAGSQFEKRRTESQGAYVGRVRDLVRGWGDVHHDALVRSMDTLTTLEDVLAGTTLNIDKLTRAVMGIDDSEQIEEERQAAIAKAQADLEEVIADAERTANNNWGSW